MVLHHLHFLFDEARALVKADVAFGAVQDRLVGPCLPGRFQSSEDDSERERGGKKGGECGRGVVSFAPYSCRGRQFSLSPEKKRKKKEKKTLLPEPELLPSHALVHDDVLDVARDPAPADELLLQEQRRRRDDFLLFCLLDDKDLVV